MTRRPPPAPDPTLEWLAQQDEALTVPCPAPDYCCKPIGESCVDQWGKPLMNQPGHRGRRALAAKEAGHQLDPLPAVAADPDPTPAPRPRTGGQGTTQKCNHCEGELQWARTRKDALMPVDAEPSDKGNVLLTFERGQLRADVIGKQTQAAAMRAAGKQLHLHHAVTCPYASRWSTAASRRSA